jgi:2,4-dienoyl-CoA reductase (NADPH2)
VIGAGGIGFDVAEYLLHEDTREAPLDDAVRLFQDEWGVDPSDSSAGGLRPAPAGRATPRGHAAAAQAR